MDKNRDFSFLVSDGREPLPPGTALYERIGDLEHYTLGPLLGAGATG